MLGNLIDWVVVIAFGCWFLITLLNQFAGSGIARRIRMLDFFAVVPIWTFFAPNPGRTDSHVLFRDLNVDGNPGEWRELRVPEPNAFRFFWNPNRRVRKALLDWINTLLQPVGSSSTFPKSRLLEVTYILLLTRLSNTDRSPISERRQFALARTHGFGSRDEPALLFFSSWHRLT